MTNEQKVKALRIIYGGLVVLAIILACTALVMSRLSHKSLSKEITSLESSISEVIGIQNETLDKVKTNSENILLLYQKISATDEVIAKIVEVMEKDGIDEADKVLINDNIPPEETKIVVKKPLWKKIFYFWNWCEKTTTECDRNFIQ